MAMSMKKVPVHRTGTFLFFPAGLKERASFDTPVAEIHLGNGSGPGREPVNPGLWRVLIRNSSKAGTF